MHQLAIKSNLRCHEKMENAREVSTKIMNLDTRDQVEIAETHVFSHKQHFANTSRRAKVYGKTRYNLTFFVPFWEQIKKLSPGTD